MTDKIAHFRILEKLGEGGMGVVYKAHDEKLRRQVALKVLPRSVAADPERRRRLLREARAAAAVAHPHLAAIYEAGEENDDVYVAMEFVDGITLRKAIADGPLPVDKALPIARAVLQALSRAHRMGIVHRDLKPENVMLTEDGLVKVLDFGIATVTEKESEGAPTVSRITEEGLIVGTPGYMAPEQLMGKRVDARADVFAFGVLLVELLTGQFPWAGDTPVARLIAAARDAASVPSRLDARVPVWLDPIVARCLAKEPSDRYDAAADVLAALDAGPTAVVAPARLWPRRALPWLLGASLLVVGAFALRTAARPRALPSSPEPNATLVGVPPVLAAPASAGSAAEPLLDGSTVAPASAAMVPGAASAGSASASASTAPARKPSSKAKTESSAVSGPLDDQK